MQVEELLLIIKYFGSTSWSTLHNELFFIISCSKKKANPYIDKK